MANVKVPLEQVTPGDWLTEVHHADGGVREINGGAVVLRKVDVDERHVRIIFAWHAAADGESYVETLATSYAVVTPGVVKTIDTMSDDEIKAELDRRQQARVSRDLEQVRDQGEKLLRMIAQLDAEPSALHHQKMAVAHAIADLNRAITEELD